MKTYEVNLKTTDCNHENTLWIYRPWNVSMKKIVTKAIVLAGEKTKQEKKEWAVYEIKRID